MTDTARRAFLKRSLIGGMAVGISPTLLAGQPTPNETAGPFYPVTPQKDRDFDLTKIDGRSKAALGEVVSIKGRVIDTEGNPVENATVDIWQANAAGRYNHPHDTNPAPLDPNFQGWAIVQSGQNGEFSFKTILPGPYPVSKQWTRPPHIHFKVSKAGYEEVVTQMYFPDHELNLVDTLLQRKTSEEREMMIAKHDKEQSGGLTYNVVLKKV